MTLKMPSIILNSDGGRSLSKPSFDITFSGTVETKRSCNMFSLLHYFELAPSRADENVMSNRSAKIGVHWKMHFPITSFIRSHHLRKRKKGRVTRNQGESQITKT